MTSRVLLIDDDVELVSLLQDYLQQDGFATSAAYDGERALQILQGEIFDIVVLDVMMPRASGVEVLSSLRKFSNVPVLMLTARGDDFDRIMGLELGADDYVAKPCTPRELAARLRAILRRASAGPDGADETAMLRVGSLLLKPANRTSTWSDMPLRLTGAEFNVLELLVRNAGQLVTKKDISEKAMGRKLARFDRSIDVHISGIRKKLAELAPGVEVIKTVRGMGYQVNKD